MWYGLKPWNNGMLEGCFDERPASQNVPLFQHFNFLFHYSKIPIRHFHDCNIPEFQRSKSIIP